MAPTSSAILLSGDEDNSSDNKDNEKDDHKFRINRKYATEYQRRKQKQELAEHHRRGGGSNSEDEDSDEDDSSVEDDSDLLNTVMDVNMLRTINAIRNKDEKIYNPDTKFFDENDSSGANVETTEEEGTQTRRTKPKRYKDVVREEILTKMETGDMSNDDDDGNDEENHEIEGFGLDDDKSSRFAYDAEQKEIRKAFLESSRDERDSHDGEAEEDLLVVKKRSKQSDPEAERKFAEEMAKLEATAGKTKDFLDPRGEIQDGERFLLDFFKQRSWIDADDEISAAESDHASNEEVVMKPAAASGKEDDDENDDVSLDELDKADDYEAKYNFRFEEAAAENRSGADLSNISYARGQTMNTLRRKDETRREKRQARLERKAAERKAKEEQLRRLKNAKRQEMEEKMQQIKAVLGGAPEQDDEVDEVMLMKLLEGDFDPDKFESLMKETYGDDYYKKTDNEWKNDQDVRSSLKRDEDGDLLVGQDDEDGGLYDAANDDEDPGKRNDSEDGEDVEEEEWPDDMEDVEDEPAESTIERKVKDKMMDELYKLDYEDIVAGMPTRFKYKEVQPNRYGLSTEEILFARDSTLKQYVSLKKLAPFSDKGEYVVDGRKRRRFRSQASREIEEYLATEGPKEEKQDLGPDECKKKRRRKRKKTSDTHLNRGETQQSAVEEAKEQPSEVRDEAQPKSKRRRRKKKDQESNSAAESSTGGKISQNEPSIESGKELPNDEPESINNSQSTNQESPKKKGNNKSEKSRKPSGGKKKMAKKSKHKIEGVSQSRLASYGL